jgi:hypothetical protein
LSQLACSLLQIEADATVALLLEPNNKTKVVKPITAINAIVNNNFDLFNMFLLEQYRADLMGV